MRRFLALVLLALLAAAATLPGEALAADDVAAESFVEAKELYNRGKYAQALPLFRDALARSGSPNARLFVARCLRETGELVAAYEEMQQTLADASSAAANDPKYVPTRDAAAAEIAKLDKLVARVIVALPEGAGDVEVELAGAPLPAEALGKPRAVLPGEVTLVARAPGRAPAQKTVTLAAGALETVVLELGPAAAEGAPDDGAPAPDADEGGLGTVRAVGIAVAALGVAGLVVTGVTGALAQGKAEELDEACGGARCTDPSYAEVVDEGETLKLVANVSLAAGSAALLAGVAMILFGGPADDDDETTAFRHRGGVALSHQGGFVSYGLSF